MKELLQRALDLKNETANEYQALKDRMTITCSMYSPKVKNHMLNEAKALASDAAEQYEAIKRVATTVNHMEKK
jgi:hypothetical protein